MAKKDIHNLTIKKIASMFGTTVSNLPQDSKKIILNSNLSFKKLDQKRKEEVILNIIKKIDSSNLTFSGKGQKQRWVKGWNENLQNFINSNYDISQLIPKFIRPDKVIRLNQDYVETISNDFEINYYKAFRKYLFHTYLKEAQTIYEFGCGTGFNLVELAQLYPEKELHGLDWVSAPKKIMKLLRKIYGYNIHGHVFDMFYPDKKLKIQPGSAILAIGALEQIGKNYEPFLQFILKSKPSIFIHVDSIIELYDANNLADYLAVKFDRRRNYLDGYLTRLQELEEKGVLEIVKTQRSNFGSLFHDGYSYIIWKPK